MQEPARGDIQVGSFDASILKDKSKTDLQEILDSTDLLHDIFLAHHSLPTQHASLLAQEEERHRDALARIATLREQIVHQRQITETAVAATKSLEAEWERVEKGMYLAQKPYSAQSLLLDLKNVLSEAERTSEGQLASFLDSSGGNVEDFIREYRKTRKLRHLRAEKVQRWQDGRVGGFR